MASRRNDTRGIRRGGLRVRPCAVALLVWLSSLVPAFAHDPGLSAVELRATGSELLAHVTFSNADRPTLDARVLEVSFDGRRAAPRDVRVESDDSGAIHCRMGFTRPSSARLLRIVSPLLAELPRGHRQYVSVKSVNGETLAERILSADGAVWELALREPAHAAENSGSREFPEFLALGVKHILTGYDHLLFLFGILIVSGTFRSSAKVITCFTLAHSLTLALATLELVRLPTKIVEPLIAASIAYVGAENLIRRDASNTRGLLTFAFGLVHGLGFAGVLREMGIGSRGAGVVVPLVSFNLGVELGQIGVAALALPLIWQLRASPKVAPRWAPACSVAITLAGSYWLIERTLAQ